MRNHYLEAAEIISEMANKYSNDNDLANVLRAGCGKISKLAVDNGMLFKNASVEPEKDKEKVVVGQ